MAIAPTVNPITYLPPKGNYEIFADDNHYSEKVREWGLSTTKEVKKQFLYKEKNLQYTVTVKGYEVYEKNSELNTIVIEFQDGSLSCIHPAYLKEMQSSSFGKGTFTDAPEKASPSTSQEAPKEEKQPEENKSTKETKETNKKNEKKEKPVKLELPEEKVHFTAAVKQFALSWNNFNEENDEVVILENVVIKQENPVDVGLSWCSHSKTLKKYELAPGDTLEFDGKIVKKKLPKGKDAEEEFIVSDPVPYKINNPSKIKKG
ncbi:hypothetical protein RRV45_10905 [Bacillus sp. DTU_2020_1000418_1_SI_GHA_SEK_038]|uniref:hypothetical protein n=1 Tax=Bacillus sp. DTU_2020_1000418_1_SI_GHA_SEK_038 TaxID=3077585 RepID=UPI0028E314C6|nr:hypothetical protein [Bacillus sp. DTU_2020_1000418_1_SI_GHA_SEK_038]WNS77463.1 hypothetical protein RRV45_10905 [Bacillus sp. DTU_2020_1000418_1_SI_GHA_SEK_038]